VGEEDEDSSSPEKPELPKSAMAWSVKNAKKPMRKNQIKRKEISPIPKPIETSNPFDALPKRARNDN
jgi:hypothetical protein